jgi:3-oxoacyl-[acyl-carrier protein] reductase
MTEQPATQPTTAPVRKGDKLEGRVAFVTGGTRGIGAAICRNLAGQGATVAAGYAGNDFVANKFREGFAATYGTPITLHKGNIADPQDCRRTIDSVIAAHGRLDILVNNAGITIDKTVLKMQDDDWLKVLNVNLSGAFFLSQAGLRHMAERGSGRIVNVSSVIGETGNIGQANYAASKSGLFGLTKTLALEAAYLLAKSGKLTEPGSIGLTVNTVTPGFIATEMLEHIPPKVMERIVAQIPLGRLGKPEEVARVVHFLAADASSYITGQVWGVNGGLDM